LIEAAIEHYALAVIALGMPRRHELREEAASFAPAIGLLGSSAEDAMAACLVHVYGSAVAYSRDDRFKTAAEILHDFRELLRNPPARAQLFAEGVGNPDKHFAEILSAAVGFPLLITMRAGGLHNGFGPSYEVGISQAHKVYEFLALLGKSQKIRTYFSTLRPPPRPSETYQVLIPDLLKRVRESRGLAGKAQALASLYLVLPNIPERAPDWLTALRRLVAVPTEADLALLLDVAQQALPADLLRVGRADGQAVSVVVRPDDPDAMPIAPQNLRRTFTQMRDQLLADIGNANGRLDQGQLDLPPRETVLQIFAGFGPKQGILRPGHKLTAHEAWSFVAASLNSNGTPGPYWFIVQECDDVGQLLAQVERAANLPKGKVIAKRLPELTLGIKAMLNNSELPVKSSISKAFLELEAAAESCREKLANAKESPSYTPAVDDWYVHVRAIVEDNDHVGPALELLLGDTSQNSLTARQYWARRLCEAATDPDDVAVLAAVAQEASLSPAHTAAKKALRLLDFHSYGPRIATAP
jgi:hypothetical protein